MIHSRKTSALILPATVAVLAVVLTAGCGDDEDDPMASGSETGRLRVEMSDAPFPYAMIDSALVSIDGVEVHHSVEVDGSAWVTVDDTPRELNLLDLQNGATMLLAEVELPVGAIDQIRLHVVDAGVVLTDGRSFDLDIPSGEQSGVKVFPEPDIMVDADLVTNVLLDFDVSNSFHPIPASPNQVEDIQAFQFRPSIHVANLGATGSISGHVFTTLATEDELDDLVLPDVSVTVYSGSDDVGSTSTSIDGSFLVMGLAPGEYTVVATTLGFVQVSTDVMVEAGEESSGLELRLDPIGP